MSGLCDLIDRVILPGARKSPIQRGVLDLVIATEGSVAALPARSTSSWATTAAAPHRAVVRGQLRKVIDTADLDCAGDRRRLGSGALGKGPVMPDAEETPRGWKPMRPRAWTTRPDGFGHQQADC